LADVNVTVLQGICVTHGPLAHVQLLHTYRAECFGHQPDLHQARGIPAELNVVASKPPDEKIVGP
jgi:hypothetical protein